MTHRPSIALHCNESPRDAASATLQYLGDVIGQQTVGLMVNRLS
ncbi:MAG: hypothetical protein QOF20_1868 [Acidimicrobiaceae bacterium]|jgi:hypothetical protein|nr:hypothetical protein [Acidimicrobiaceae bacterium]